MVVTNSVRTSVHSGTTPTVTFMMRVSIGSSRIWTVRTVSTSPAWVTVIPRSSSRSSSWMLQAGTSAVTILTHVCTLTTCHASGVSVTVHPTRTVSVTRPILGTRAGVRELLLATSGTIGRLLRMQAVMKTSVSMVL